MGLVTELRGAAPPLENSAPLLRLGQNRLWVWWAAVKEPQRPSCYGTVWQARGFPCERLGGTLPALGRTDGRRSWHSYRTAPRASARPPAVIA